MRILLQHQGSGAYLQRPGIWVADAEEAFDFPSSGHALYFCQQHKLNDVKLVFHFAGHHAYIERPVGSEELRAAPALR
jgi:hypothetical protein